MKSFFSALLIAVLLCAAACAQTGNIPEMNRLFLTDTKMRAALNSDGTYTLVVGGQISALAATLTTPSTGVLHAANSVISDSASTPTVVTFANACRVPGGSGTIWKFRAMTNYSATTARLRVHIYSTAPTAINDASPLAPPPPPTSARPTREACG